MASHNARPARWLSALALAATLALPVAASPATPSPAAHGLIVKLRDSAVQGVTSPTEHAARAMSRVQRLRDVLSVAGVSAATRPVGGTFEHVDLGRNLTSAEAEDVAARLRARPEVEWVVPNELEHRLTTPSDPLFAADAGGVGGQWWLFPAGGSNANDIDARRRGVAGVQTAWSTTEGSPRAVIAVLDTGVTSHPDLDANVLPGRDFVSTVEYAGDGNGWDADPHDPGDGVTAADRAAHPTLFADCPESESSWHGTTIAGMLAGLTNNGQYGAAMSWDGRVVPVRVAGKCGAEVADIVDGMRWAAGLPVVTAQGTTLPRNPNPARIVNISFGGSSACNAAYQETIDELRTAGVLVVAAAGNENGAVVRPASCRGVLAVGALNRDGFKASYSNFGPAVGISTVGGDPRELGGWGMVLGDTGLLALGNDGVQSPGASISVRAAGTSFAAPIVAGVAGLMLSVNPALTVDQLIAGMKGSARPHVVSASIGTCSVQNPGRCICTTTTCGAGILDAPQALAYAAQPDSYVAPARTAESIDNADVATAVALGADLPPNASDAASSPSSGSGGGASGGAALALLLAAIAALVRAPRRRA
jgi:serine protease